MRDALCWSGRFKTNVVLNKHCRPERSEGPVPLISYTQWVLRYAQEDWSAQEDKACSLKQREIYETAR